MTKLSIPENLPRVIVTGQMFPASRTRQRIDAMRAPGCEVDTVSTMPEGHDYETPPTLMARIRHRLRIPSDPADANNALLRAVAQGADILWLEAADMIRAGTLRRAKAINPDIAIVCYSEDDMMNPGNRTRWQQATFPLIDLWVTTKSLNTRADELPSLGIKRILFVNNSYDPGMHRPVEVDQADRAAFGAPISFIGTYERPRAQSVLSLAARGFEVRVWGNGWGHMQGVNDNLRIEGRPAYNEEFAKVVSASRINLCFLRHANRDLQTCRSIELPGCAGFMVHERNPEIEALLNDGDAAVFFSSDDELAEVCAYWMDRDEDRLRIGLNARRRVEELELSHRANILRVLNELSRIDDGTPQ